MVISTGGFFAAMNSKDGPWMGFVVAFGVWALFFWSYFRHSKKAAERKFRERIFEQHMRSNRYNNRR